MGSKVSSLIDPKLVRIVQLFLKKDDELFHLHKISTEAKVPLGTTFRLIKIIKDAGLIETVVVGKTKLYKTNKAAAKEFMILR